MFGRVPPRSMVGSTSAPIRNLFVRSRKTLDPLVAVREDPVEIAAETDRMGCLFAK